jgi:hypothetical protein
MSSAAFVYQLFRWLAQVNADPELPAGATKVAVALAPLFNEAQGGAAWPSLKTIGEACAMSKEHVRKYCVPSLKTQNYLKVEPGKQGRGRSARYWMIQKGNATCLLKGKPTGLSEAVKGKSEPDKRQVDLPDTSKEYPSKEYRAVSDETRPGSFVDERFEELWETFLHRPEDPREPAREAFKVALVGGASPTAIVAAAVECRANYEKASTDPKYIPKLETWLKRESWKYSPSAKHKKPPLSEAEKARLWADWETKKARERW